MTPHLTPRDRLPALSDAIEAAELVAIDTEFHAENRYHPQLCLVQVHVPGQGIHLLDALDERTLPPLADALRTTPWLLHAGKQDLRLLAPVLGGVPEVVIDTQIAAGLIGPVYPQGYAELAREWAGVVVEKAATLSDWTRRPLGEEQLKYAGDDVRHLPTLWGDLRRRLEAAERLPIAFAAFAEARAAALHPIDPDETWREIPQSIHLDEAGRTALRALAAWRERVAVDLDQAPRAVLSDAMLADLARRRPATLHRILSNRRFPRKVADRHGGDLLASLHAAAAPADAIAVVAPQTEAERMVQFIRLAVATLGAARGWSQRLVLPDADIERAVLSGYPAVSFPLAASWRNELLGSALSDLARGTTTLTVAGTTIVTRSIPPQQQG